MNLNYFHKEGYKKDYDDHDDHDDYDNKSLYWKHNKKKIHGKHNKMKNEMKNKMEGSALNVDSGKNFNTIENLIQDALEYYDINTEKYDDFFKSIKFIKLINALKDMDHNSIILYNNDKKELLTSRYEIIGVYTNQSKTWTWAWSNPKFRKNTTIIARKIVNYGMELDPESRFLKTELITSRFRITNPIQLDIHAAIASYLSKKTMIFKYQVYNNFRPGTDGLVDITNIPDIGRNEYLIYFMFLLDNPSI